MTTFQQSLMNAVRLACEAGECDAVTARDVTTALNLTRTKRRMGENKVAWALHDMAKAGYLERFTVEGMGGWMTFYRPL